MRTTLLRLRVTLPFRLCLCVILFGRALFGQTFAAGVVTLVSGTGSAPSAITSDNSGDLYFATYDVRTASHDLLYEANESTGEMTLIGGGGAVAPSATPTNALSVSFQGIGGLALDGAGNLYLTEGADLDKLDLATGDVVVVNNQLFGSALSFSGGNLYFATQDSTGNHIDQVPVDQPTQVTVLSSGGADSCPTFGPIRGIAAYDAGGGSVDLFIADTSNHIIQLLQYPGGQESIIAGGGTAVPSSIPDGATQVLLKAASGLSVSGPWGSNNDIYIDITDDYGLVERVRYNEGDIRVIAGGGTEDPSQTPIAPLDALFWLPGPIVSDGSALFVADDQAYKIYRVSFVGLGVSLSPSSLSFPGEPVGGSATSQNVNLTVFGDEPLAISSIKASSGFESSTTCQSPVPAGSQCSVALSFAPISAGNQAGVLTITDNAPDSPQSVILSGTGQDFSLLAATSAASVTAGQTASYTLVLQSVGGFNQTVSLSCSGAPAKSACGVPASVAMPGNVSVPFAVSVVTTASTSATPLAPGSGPDSPSSENTLWLLTAALVASILILMTATRRLRIASIAILAASFLGCGGGTTVSGTSVSGTPPGAYTLTVTAVYSSGQTTLTHSTTLTLNVK